MAGQAQVVVAAERQHATGRRPAGGRRSSGTTTRRLRRRWARSSSAMRAGNSSSQEGVSSSCVWAVRMAIGASGRARPGAAMSASSGAARRLLQPGDVVVLRLHRRVDAVGDPAGQRAGRARGWLRPSAARGSGSPGAGPPPAPPAGPAPAPGRRRFRCRRAARESPPRLRPPRRRRSCASCAVAAHAARRCRCARPRAAAAMCGDSGIGQQDRVVQFGRHAARWRRRAAPARLRWPSASPVRTRARGHRLHADDARIAPGQRMQQRGGRPGSCRRRCRCR